MKTHLFTTLRGAGILLASVCFFSATYAAPSAPASAHEKRIPKKALEKYDTNHDGKLDDQEQAVWEADKKAQREARKAEMLEKYDTNKDGKLDKSEREAMKKDREKTMAAKKRKAPDSESEE